MSYTNGLDKPSDYFNTKLYTGNGSTQSITGVGFQPDWVWIKRRNNAADHKLYDVVRGATKVLESSGTSAEGTDANGLTAFNSDGFSLGSSASHNGLNDTFASWNWLAGGTASSNTDGSITSSVSANTTAGFSVVTYTGNSSGSNSDTVGHGLASAPSVIIVKSRSASDTWAMYHQSNGTGKHQVLNLSNAVSTDANIYPTAPTSTVFYPGSQPTTNSLSRTYVAYCFAEKKGFSKFGSYTGNGSTDGTFVYTGFKPAMIIFKNTTAEFWNIFDNKRDPFNEADAKLYPNGSNAEASTSQLDFVSNGFKLRSSEPEFNQSGTEIIYMAFAENPFVTSTGIPTTAR